MPVEMWMDCLTPTAWSRERVQVMDVSFVLRSTVAVRTVLPCAVNACASAIVDPFLVYGERVREVSLT